MTNRNGFLVGASVLVLLSIFVLPWSESQNLAQVNAVALQPGPVLKTNFWVNHVAFSPDGRTLVTAGCSMGQQAELTAWDVPQGTKRFALAGHRLAIHTVAFSADGSVLATAGHDDTVRFWDPCTGFPQKLLHVDDVVTMDLSPDGRHFATTSLKKQVSLWEVATGKRLHDFPGSGRPAFAPDGRTLIVGDQSVVKRIDMETGKEVDRWGPSAETTFAVSLSRDGRQLAVIGYFSPKIEVWDASCGRLALTLDGHDEDVGAIAFAPDGLTLASGGLGRTVRLWDLASGRLLATGNGHSARISALAFSPDGQNLVSAGYDRTVRFWRLDSTQP